MTKLLQCVCGNEINHWYENSTEEQIQEFVSNIKIPIINETHNNNSFVMDVLKTNYGYEIVEFNPWCTSGSGRFNWDEIITSYSSKPLIKLMIKTLQN